MSNHVYKQVEITGSSPKGMQDAIENAITRAAKTIKHMDWFTVTETRGALDNGKVAHWQVTLKIGFRLE
jgi:dodecin